ncbi:uncharacterized protein LOC117653241 isoform X4 [Thrips palmi]|uniref:Uncharacterized protein LOC117653241 isoform X4 n=1 Tax=Thrips palmi TaxID=161013 RepID=A0A6P9AB19_THRPL|nr:uncharacterized protein LOC117653241 isoform X4 [Thrips palmi]
MAGVVKGVQQVVSSCPNGTTGSTANSNQCDAFSSDPDPLNGVVDNFSFSAEVNTNNDLLGLHPASTPSSDDLSLQDLIDSELALRISSGKAANDSNQDGLLLDLSEDGDESEEVNSVERRPDYVNGVNGVNGVVNGNLVSDFLDRERSHTDLTDDNDNDNAHAETDGDESLSLSKSLSSNAAPLCSGEGEELDDLDMASELGSDGPADSDFSANVPDGQAARPGLGDAVLEQAEQDTEEEADEATLAEDISLASDRSQERTGSLLDLDPLRPDSPPGCGPGAAPGSAGGGSGSGVGLVLGPTDTGPTGTAGTGTAGTSSEQQPGEDEAGEAREGEGRSTTPLGSLLAPGPCSPCSGDGLSAAATAAPPPHAQEQEQQDAEESDKSKLQDDDGGLLLQPLESPDHVPSPSPDLCVDANRDASVLSEDNSMDSSVLSAVPSGPGPDPAGFEEGFETWSTVEEAVNDTDLLAGTAGTNGQVQDEVAPQPENRASPDLDTESVSETSEKKTVSKKKKTDGTESTKKKSRKSKKSDEKENISVLTNGHGLNGHSDNKFEVVSTVNGAIIPHSNGYADHSVVEDDLSNVCVKDLKSAYASLTKTEISKDVVKDLKDIDHDIIYCGPIKNLKQTYCSEAIKECNGTRSPDTKETIATGISIRDLRRSFGDLRNCENSENGVEFTPEEDISSEGKARSLGDLRRLSRDLYRPDINNTSCSRKPIHTGVSVKALRASYCSLINLNEPPVSDSRQSFFNSEILLSPVLKSSFSKFDQLSKKTVLHVRSVDASKVQKQFNEASSTSPEAQTNCKACGKQVFVMEQIKAEKSVWHKNCFRCKECSKQLTVDIYSSNEGDIYCKPHFRELFKPKAVVEDSPEPIRRRKPELIIRENQPVELPPDVVRASDKPDLGLEELSSLNVKSRFQVFEKTDDRSLEVEKSPSNVNVKRSPSILSKLAKFQAKGMDIGVTDESLNGIPYEESSTSSEEEEDDEEEDGDIVKSRRATRERPMSFSKMEDVKSRWETGSTAKKEERREERRQEIQTIRSRLFMGKQGKMKEMYEQAVKESEQPAARRGAEVRSEKAKSIKEKFERGETLVSDGEEGEDGDRKIKDEDLGVFEAGISKKSRSHFMELDASAAKTAQQTTPSRPAAKDGNKKREVLTNQSSSEVVKASDKIEDVQVETADISSKFKFFETYKAPEKQKKAFRITPPREGQVKTESPEREVYRDPDVVRADDSIEGDELQHSMTTSKMLSIFRQMEEKAQRDDVPDGPKPLKCFTPPPDYKPESDSSEDDRSDEDDDEDDEEGDEDESDGVIRSSVKAEDEFLQAAKAAAKAKTLRAKFEHWEEQENNINSGGGNINPTLLESEHESIESTKSLRARFESLRNEAEAPKEKPRPKVNRFVEIQTSCAEFCDSCEKKVYPLEKVETGGKLFHKGCFRCMQCSCILRMESYTLNNGKLYCIPHFKQLFISKGNYDEGFGLDQHKRKWNSTMKENGDILLSGIDANGNNH